MNGNSEWIEKKVASMLRDMRRCGFWESAIADAKHFQKVYGYAWDVALKISWDYWCGDCSELPTTED